MVVNIAAQPGPPSPATFLGKMSADPNENEVEEYKLLDGLVVPPFIDTEWVKKMKDIKLRPDDVWIVAYPKCGTTWTQQIVRLIINASNGRGEDKSKITLAVPWVETFGPIQGTRHKYFVDLDQMASPRAFKSHFPYDMMPCGPPNTTPGRYIFIIRNPKDVAVSYFHHYRSFMFLPPPGWDEFFEKFLKGEVYFGDYFDCALSWWVHKDDDNVLFLKYEDMKKDLPFTVAQIAKFIRQDISKEVVDEIARKTIFSNMKDDNSTNYMWMSKFRRPNEATFMRKGVVGHWKNYFTPEQTAWLDSVYIKRLKGTGLHLDQMPPVSNL